VLVLKYMLMILGLGLFSSAGALVAYDIYLSTQLQKIAGVRRNLRGLRETLPPRRNCEFGGKESVARSYNEQPTISVSPGRQPKPLRVARCAALMKTETTCLWGGHRHAERHP